MKPKWALVTGSGRRLGAEVARYLAERSIHVIVHTRKRTPEGEALVGEIVKDGGGAIYIIGDLTIEQERTRLLREVTERAGALDILVNNASEFEYDFPGSGDVDFLRRSLEIHAIVPFILIEYFASRCGDNATLDVFNILDQKLNAYNPDYYSYTVGKAALRGITRCWQTSKAKNVRVFGIMPGNLYPSGPQTEEEFLAAGRSTLLEHAPDAIDICEAIAFFHMNRGMAAQDLAVDAGEHLTLRDRDPAFDARFTSRKP
jgi:NAD(P)-dependent dehydrogenase (short-subunit alcohol dehydrogenase family)